MTLSVEKKITFGVVLTLAVLLINAFLSYQATRILIDNDQRVRHTYRVINELELTLSTVKDAETGERGYIITGLDEYLTPYYVAVAQIDKHIHTLTELTAENPTQRARIPALQSKIRDRVESLRLGIEYRRSGDVEDANHLIVSGVGKRMMDDLWQFVNAMEVDENALLNQRTEESRKSQRNAILTFIVANLVACTVLLGTWAIIINGINARKRAEEEVRQQRRQLQVTLSSIADAVISCDTQGNVTFLNPIAESLTGWTQEEACGQPLAKVFDIINEQTGRTVDNPAVRAIREGAIVGLANHTILRTKQGREVPIDDSASPIKTPGGRLLGAVLVFRDITERRRSEDAATRAHEERLQLLAAAETAREKAEEASRSKDEFLAVLSHELRTPLTAVFGWTQLLQNRDVNEEMRAKAMDVIDRNVRAQIQLIDDLLNVSQIIAGKLQIRREMIDPLDVVKRAIETARPSAEAKDIVLHLESPSTVPPISADPARLQQITWNLLSNAVKFTSKGGRIEVRVQQVRSDLEIVVADNGQGISAEFLPQVFNRFSQADSSTTRSHGGLGLGLALVRQLMELHGGTVSAQSGGLGQGSAFTISFPLPAVIERFPEERTPGKDRETRLRLHGIRVLVVEDEPDTREMISLALQRFGASVGQAGSASEALRQFVDAPPNIVISDIGIRDMDGYELLSVLRRRMADPPPAIALTAYATPADRKRALDYGFQAHMTKPIELSQLISTIADLLGRKAV